MRFMEWIRRKGHWFLWAILIIFTITLFFGLTTGTDFWHQQSGGPGSMQQDAAATTPTLLAEGDLSEVALRVNGRDVSNLVFQQTLQQMMDAMSVRPDDAGALLAAYGNTASFLAGQELIMARGEELGIKLTGEDYSVAKAEISAAYLQSSSEQSGNVVGDLVGRLGDIRAEREAFRTYLQTQGLDEKEWERAAFRSLYAEKVREELRDKAEQDRQAEVEALKTEIDEKLAAGEAFSDLAREHSDGMSAGAGGDLDWIGRGLLEPEITEVVFGTEAGQTTEWLEIPAGWQKFEVYERKTAEGADFESKREELIKQVRAAKNDEAYEPTDAELAEQYEQARARVIELHVGDSGAAEQELRRLSETAVVEFNNPYVLAFQALTDNKLEPMRDVTYEQLVQIAQLAPAGDDYDYELIRRKLELGRKAPAPADEDTADAEAAEAEATDAAAADAEAADDAAAAETETEPTADDAAADATETDADAEAAAAEAAAEAELYVPIYALALGLLKTGISEGGSNSANAFPYLVSSKVYMDWLNETEHTATQPIKRDEARQDLEQVLARVTEVNNYSAQARAWRGLNLAWLAQPEAAAEHLELAMKYAPRQDGPIWEEIREGWEILDRQDKVAEVEALLTKFRQETLRRHIEQSGAGTPGSEGGIVNVPLEDIINTDDLVGNGTGAGADGGGGE